MNKSEINKYLRNDVKLLGDLLGQVIKKLEGQEVYQQVENIRSLAKSSLVVNDASSLELVSHLTTFTDEELIPIVKGFSTFLNLANIAEQYHRVRLSRLYKLDPEINLQPGTINSLLPNLLQQGIPCDKILSHINTLNLNLVLTAHPTEVKRRTLLLKFEKISKELEFLDQNKLDEIEYSNCLDRLKEQISSIWLTDDSKIGTNLNSCDEARWCFAIIESSLFEAIPKLYRTFDQALSKHCSQQTNINYKNIKFSYCNSNNMATNNAPNSEDLIKVINIARWIALDLYTAQINKLKSSLSINSSSKALCNKYKFIGDSKEPYRVLLSELELKILNTKKYIATIINPKKNKDPYDPDNLLLNTSEFIEVLDDCYQSLESTSCDSIANGVLLDTIRQVNCFGLSLIKHDIAISSNIVNTILSMSVKKIKGCDYTSWSFSQRREFLIKELKSDRKIIPVSFSNNARFEKIASLFFNLIQVPREALGSIILKDIVDVSDILALILIQRDFFGFETLPVVPFFENKISFDYCIQVMDDLLNLPIYRNICNNYQEVMLGYSEPAKDVGILSATWLQYTTFEKLIELAKNVDVKLVFYHGRGGSIGRGGWPTYEAILSQPPHALENGVKITQQGEIISNRFGVTDLAVRNLELYYASSLEAVAYPCNEPKNSWRALMNDIARVSQATYTKQIYETDGFIDHCFLVTPLKELNNLVLGIKNNIASINDIKPVSWIYAWTQNRLLAPSWLGFGSALSYTISTNRQHELTDMIENWPFFYSLLSMCEMVFSKVDVNIARYYEQRLLGNKSSIGKDLEQRFSDCRRYLLDAMNSKDILAGNESLKHNITVRNYYLLPLHLMQVELLERLRKNNNTNQCATEKAILISMAGIAAGMRNTG